MPHYFFHLLNDVDVPDPEGRPLASDEEAWSVAIDECREMMTEAVRSDRLDLSHRINVEDINHQALFTVRYEDAVTITRSRS